MRRGRVATTAWPGFTRNGRDGAGLSGRRGAGRPDGALGAPPSGRFLCVNAESVCVFGLTFRTRLIMERLRKDLVESLNLHDIAHSVRACLEIG
jgi:hypothetical protein